MGSVVCEDSLRINNGTVDGDSELGCTVVVGIAKGKSNEKR